MFLHTVSLEEARDEIADIYRNEIASMGLLMEATTCWTTRPEVLPHFERFSHGIKSGF